MESISNRILDKLTEKYFDKMNAANGIICKE